MANWCNVKLQGKLNGGAYYYPYSVFVCGAKQSSSRMRTNGMNTKNGRLCVRVLDDSRAVRWMTDGRRGKTFTEGGLKRIELEDKHEDEQPCWEYTK
jgi:hypothetical protein